MATSVLDTQLCVAVYKAAHAFTAAYRPLLEPHGLTYPQYVALLALWENSPITVKALGEYIDLDSGTLSPLLARLEAAGHISKTRSTHDARVVEIAVTAQGRELQQDMHDVPLRIAGCTGVTRDQGRELLSQLQALTDALRA